MIMNFYKYLFGSKPDNMQDIKRDHTPWKYEYMDCIYNDKEYTCSYKDKDKYKRRELSEKGYELLVREIDEIALKHRPYHGSTEYSLLFNIPHPYSMNYHLRSEYSKFKCNELLGKIKAYSDFPERYKCSRTGDWEDPMKNFTIYGILYEMVEFNNGYE